MLGDEILYDLGFQKLDISCTEFEDSSKALFF